VPLSAAALASGVPQAAAAAAGSSPQPSQAPASRRPSGPAASSPSYSPHVSMSASCAARSRTHGAVSFMHLASTLSREPSSAQRSGSRQPRVCASNDAGRSAGRSNRRRPRLPPPPAPTHPTPRGGCTGSCGCSGPAPVSWARPAGSASGGTPSAPSAQPAPGVGGGRGKAGGPQLGAQLRCTSVHEHRTTLCASLDPCSMMPTQQHPPLHPSPVFLPPLNTHAQPYFTLPATAHQPSRPPRPPSPSRARCGCSR
jgi:hypothetical protein